MSCISKFEDIEVWKRSRKFTNSIFIAFSHVKNYSFRDQIERAAVSISNNIAEGYERSGNKEFVKFLYYAKGSAAEVRSMLYNARDLGLITNEEFEKLSSESVIIAKQLSKFITTIKI
ncbi:MAG: four helix bundle protein [Patescibacteria group bacterium]